MLIYMHGVPGLGGGGTPVLMCWWGVYQGSYTIYMILVCTTNTISREKKCQFGGQATGSLTDKFAIFFMLQKNILTYHNLTFTNFSSELTNNYQIPEMRSVILNKV